MHTGGHALQKDVHCPRNCLWKRDSEITEIRTRDATGRHEAQLKEGYHEGNIQKNSKGILNGMNSRDAIVFGIEMGPEFS
jgi:hypothetical protein